VNCGRAKQEEESEEEDGEMKLYRKILKPPKSTSNG